MLTDTHTHPVTFITEKVSMSALEFLVLLGGSGPCSWGWDNTPAWVIPDLCVSPLKQCHRVNGQLLSPYRSCEA